MLFTIDKYMIRVGSRYLQRYFSKNTAVSNTQEFILQPEDSFTSIRREGQKFLKIALLGAPNVGKSTLINQLMKRSVIIKLFIHKKYEGDNLQKLLYVEKKSTSSTFTLYLSIIVLSIYTTLSIFHLIINRYALHLPRCILHKLKLTQFILKMILS